MITSIIDRVQKNMSHRNADDMIRGIDDLPRLISIEQYEDAIDYQFVIFKQENYGHSDAYVAMYSRKCDKAQSTVNYLFKVQGSSYNVVVNRFLDAFNELSKNKFIRGKKWCGKIKNIDFRN